MYSSPAVPTGHRLHLARRGCASACWRWACRSARTVQRAVPGRTSRRSRRPRPRSGRTGCAARCRRAARRSGPAAPCGKRLTAADDPPQAHAVPALGSSRNSCSIDGTKWSVVMPCSIDRLRQVRAVPVPAGLGDDQLRTDQQRPEELPHRDIEAERRLLQDPVRRRQPVAFLHPADRFAMAPCVFMAPLGWPVEPEV